MIRKESSHSRPSRKNIHPQVSNPQNCLHTLSSHTTLSRHHFLSWAKSLATEERYVALRLQLPEMVSSYISLLKRMIVEYKISRGEVRKPVSKNFKVLEEPYQSFIDSLVFMTDQHYLDSIGFDYSCIDNPERIYDLVKSIQKIRGCKNQEKIPMLSKIESVETQDDYQTQLYRKEWVEIVADKIECVLIAKIQAKWNPQHLEDQKNQKRDLVTFWKTMTEMERQNFLRFNCDKQESLSQVLEELDIEPHWIDIQGEIQDFMKSDKKELCNRMLKWKLKKNNPFLCSYYEALFNSWKESCKGKSKKKAPKKKNKKNKRPKSIDAMSNQTNETQIKENKCQVNIKEISTEKLERDILEYSDRISECANSYFERRVLAFQRLKYLLQAFGIQIKLYGSCACGIAIENSDLDVAVDQSILEIYGNIQVKQALNCIHEILSKMNFVSDIKLINSAYIPIIKFKIDTAVEFYCESPQLYEHLHRQINSHGCVEVDLTIETTAQSFNYSHNFSNQLPIHLGIKSTAQINQWLDQYPTLRPILLILKYQLTLKKLNETYNEGLNTYSLVVMLVAAMKGFQLKNQEKIGVVMEKILRFYGWDFKETEYGIDLEYAEVYYKKKEVQGESQKKQAQIQIKDPLNNGKIMTKNCYKFPEIKQILQTIYNRCIQGTQHKIQQICSDWNPKQSKMMPQQLSQWVLGKLPDNQFENLIT